MSKSSFQSNNIDYRDIEGLDPLSPTWIYIELPDNAKKRRQVIASQLTTGPLYTHTERYSSFRDNINSVLATGKSFDQLILVDDDPVEAKDIKYFKLVSRYQHGYLGLRDPTGKPVLILKSKFKVNL